MTDILVIIWGFGLLLYMLVKQIQLIRMLENIEKLLKKGKE